MKQAALKFVQKNFGDDVAQQIRTGQRVVSASEQAVLLKAVLQEQAREAVEKMKQGQRPKPFPPVQLPGMGRDYRADAAHGQLQELDNQLSRAKTQRQQLRAGAKLISARRRGSR
jgi:hypothetical protein